MTGLLIMFHAFDSKRVGVSIIVLCTILRMLGREHSREAGSYSYQNPAGYQVGHVRPYLIYNSSPTLNPTLIVGALGLK